MMYKFTSGEWRIDEETKCAILVCSNGKMICDVSSSEDDAHLIAAAPDMYRALDILVNVEWSKQPVNLMKNIEAILAKARGEVI